ncbi:hypothetical protein V494_07255 [Pseudogymnoascus sp. VKM F-4513 (FW-928)]|nr:hypothetical protein V494_07255 [Pseudogymnoascus sp. VKM F-4513 (FW-928)]
MEASKSTGFVIYTQIVVASEGVVVESTRSEASALASRAPHQGVDGHTSWIFESFRVSALVVGQDVDVEEMSSIDVVLETGERVSRFRFDLSLGSSKLPLEGFLQQNVATGSWFMELHPWAIAQAILAACSIKSPNTKLEGMNAI